MPGNLNSSDCILYLFIGAVTNINQSFFKALVAATNDLIAYSLLFIISPVLNPHLLKD
jgi:hypothetical protein